MVFIAGRRQPEKELGSTDAMNFLFFGTHALVQF